MSIIQRSKSLLSALWRYDTRGDNRNRPAEWMKIFLWSGNMFFQKKFLSRDIPALTYSTFMSLIPVVAILFALFRGFGFDEKFVEALSYSMKGQPAVADYIVTFANNYLKNTSNSPILIVGLVLMIYSLYSLMKMIETSFNGIWEAKERTVKKTIFDYVLILAGLTFAILISSGINIPLEQIKGSGFAFLSNLASLLRYGIAFFVTFLVVTMMYKYIPNTFVSFRYVLIPSLLVSLLLNLLQHLYIYGQILLSSYNVIYGSLAIIPMFLLWIYWSWFLCVFGVVLCYSYQNLHHYDCDIDYASLSRDEVITASAMVMAEICDSFGKAELYTPKQLGERTGLPQQVVNGALRELKNAGLAYEIKSEKSGIAEQLSRYSPTMDTSLLTFGRFIEAMDGRNIHTEGLRLPIDSSAWSVIRGCKEKFVADCGEIKLKDLANNTPDETNTTV